MTGLSKKEYNQDIDYKVEKIKAMKKVAEKVTLTEFIEQYPRHDYITLGSFWYSANVDIDYSKIINNYSDISYGGTDPE